MDRSELVDAFQTAPQIYKIIFLLELCSKLTVVARNAYDFQSEDKATHLTRINEFQHRLLDITKNIALDTKIFSSEDIIDRISVIFLENDLENAALKYFNRKYGN